MRGAMQHVPRGGEGAMVVICSKSWICKGTEQDLSIARVLLHLKVGWVVGLQVNCSQPQP